MVKPIFFVSVAFLFPIIAQEQRPLSFRPVSAAWSTSLQRIIAISSAPNQVVIYDPLTNTQNAVGLTRAPLSLSVSPDGNFAAVGQDTLVSYINLASASLVRNYTVSGSVTRIALSASWIYGTFGALRISNGELNAQNTFGYSLRLDPWGPYLWSGSYRYDISTGPVTGGESLFQNNYYDSNIWFSAIPSRAYTSNGQLYTRSSVSRGFTLRTRLDIGGFTDLVDSTRLTVAISLQTQYQTPAVKDNEIVLYDAQTERIGRFIIPDYTVANRNFQARGKWIFLDRDNANIYAISQADTGSGLLNDFAILRLPITSPNPCTPTFPTTSATIPAHGATLNVAVQAPQTCIYQAGSSTSWIVLGKGWYGSGDGTMTVAVEPNRDGVQRSGTVSVGSQRFTITQPAAGAPEPLTRLHVKVVDAAFSRSEGLLALAVPDPPGVLLLSPTRGHRFVQLAKRPRSVDVSPDGTQAVVGHEGYISLVPVSFSAEIPNIVPIEIPGEGARITYGPRNYAYIQSTITNQLLSFHIPTRTIGAPTQSSFSGNYYYNNNTDPKPEIHASGTSLYLGTAKYDISNGVATYLYGSSNYSNCTNLWTTQDGLRLIDNCGTVYRSGEVQSQDFQLNGSLSGTANGVGLSSLLHVGERRTVAATVSPTSNATSFTNGTELRLYADENLGLTGSISLPRFNVGSQQFKGIGRYLFWGYDKTSIPNDGILAVVQAEQASGLVSDFGYVTYPTGSGTNCAVPVGGSASVPNTSNTGSLVVNANAACLWDAKSSVPWITVTSGGLSVGNGVVGYSVDANFSTSPRTGFITFSGGSFTVNQAASPGSVTVSVSRFGLRSAAVTVEIPVVATNQTIRWTSSSNANWAVVTSGSNGTGSATVIVTVATNPTQFERTAVVTVAGQAVEIVQAGTAGLHFVPVTPCRVSDTRNPNGAFGGPVILAQTSRNFIIPNSACGIPPNAVAYSLNATVVPRGPLGFITLWPAGQARPVASTLNSLDGRVKANAAIVRGGQLGAVSVYATDTTDVILDINGYFVPPTPEGLVFYPMAPCRLLDTRNSGGPMRAKTELQYWLGSNSNCQMPSSSRALSLNTTVVPRGPMGFLTLWPYGLSQPTVSTLNALTGTVTANAAILPTSSNYTYYMSAYATDSADLLIDVNGYFAPPGQPGGLMFYPLDPCRVMDTRSANGPLGGPALVAAAERSVQPTASNCGIPPEARGYALSATVVPNGVFGFLSLWGSDTTRPTVSTLNAVDGALTSNLAIVPAGPDGGIRVFGSNSAHVLFDVLGYFAP